MIARRCVLLLVFGCSGGTYYNVVNVRLPDGAKDASDAGCESYCHDQPDLTSLDSCAGPTPLDDAGEPIPGDAGAGDLYIVCRGSWKRSACDAPFKD